MYCIFRAIFKVFYKLFFCYRVSGIENVPADGGVIVAANHLSHLDPPLIGVVLKRRAVYMAKRPLFHYPVVGWFMRRFAIAVDRDTPRPSTIKEAVTHLKKGGLVVMFPEGMRSKDGDLGEGKRGVAMVAAMSGAKVVPTLVEGTDKALPTGARFFRPARLRVTFGTPLESGGTESSKEFQQRITNEIMERIKELKTSRRER